MRKQTSKTAVRKLVCCVLYASCMCGECVRRVMYVTVQ